MSEIGLSCTQSQASAIQQPLLLNDEVTIYKHLPAWQCILRAESASMFGKIRLLLFIINISGFVACSGTTIYLGIHQVPLVDITPFARAIAYPGLIAQLVTTLLLLEYRYIHTDWQEYADIFIIIATSIYFDYLSFQLAWYFGALSILWQGAVFMIYINDVHISIINLISQSLVSVYAVILFIKYVQEEYSSSKIGECNIFYSWWLVCASKFLYIAFKCSVFKLYWTYKCISCYGIQKVLDFTSQQPYGVDVLLNELLYTQFGDEIKKNFELNHKYSRMTANPLPKRNCCSFAVTI